MASLDNQKTKAQLIVELESLRRQLKEAEDLKLLRMRLEEKTRSTEARYKSLFNRKIFCVYEHDFAGNFVNANDATLSLLGYSKEEILTVNFTSLLDPEQAPTAIKVIEEIRDQGEQQKVEEYKLRRKDGNYVWIVTEANLLYRDGKPSSILGIAFDVTERKKVEDELRKSQQTYRMIVENTTDFIWVMNFQFQTTYQSQALERILGFTVEEQQKRTATDKYPPAQLEKFGKMLMEQVALEKSGKADPNRYITIELEEYHKDGRLVPCEATVTFVRDEKGRPIALQGVTRDISKRKQLEEQLRHVAKMDAIGQLAGGVAHDFNNLLTGILGYANLIKLRPNLENEVYDWVQTMENAALKASDLTKQLLGFARRGKHQVKSVDMHKIIKEVVALLKRTFEKNIAVSLRLNAENPVISGDPGQMHQALLNLAINARDAMPNGGELSIMTDVVELDNEYCRQHPETEPGKYLKLSITDTGVGVPDEIKERIFEPFFTTKADGKGTGMGLAMVYGIVKNHGGAVQVYTEVGHGTTFRVYLPIATGKADYVEEVGEKYTLVEGDARILLVDDEEVVRNVATDMLRGLGYEVIAVPTGAEAVEYYRDHKDVIDLVVIDMIMPEMEGRQCFLELKKINPNIKAVLSTGYGINGKAQDLLNKGMLGFLQKPYNYAELSKKINEVLRM